MKAWFLADSKSGFIWKWNLYTGKEEAAPSSDSLGIRIELNLVIYFDNYYTSVN